VLLSCAFTVLLSYAYTVLLSCAVTMLLPYAVTMLLPHAFTVLRPCAVTVLLPYAVTVLLSCAVTVLLSYAVTVLLPCAVTVLLPYAVTVLLSYAVTVLLPYAFTVLLPYAVTVLLPCAFTMLLPYAFTVLLSCAVTVLLPYAYTQSSPSTSRTESITTLDRCQSRKASIVLSWSRDASCHFGRISWSNRYAHCSTGSDRLPLLGATSTLMMLGPRTPSGASPNSAIMSSCESVFRDQNTLSLVSTKLAGRHIRFPPFDTRHKISMGFWTRRNRDSFNVVETASFLRLLSCACRPIQASEPF